MLANFSRLNPKRPYVSLEKQKPKFCFVLTYTINRAREIRKLHVAVVQQRLRNVQKSVMQSDARAKMLFCQSKPIVFCCSPSPLQKLPIAVIQKYCYHGNVTSHFSSLLHLLLFITRKYAFICVKRRPTERRYIH